MLKVVPLGLINTQQIQYSDYIYSVVKDFFPELLSDRVQNLVLQCGTQKYGLLNFSAVTVTDFISPLLSKNSKLFFDCTDHQFYFDSIIDRIHQIVELLSLDSKNVYFLINTSAAIDMYQQLIDNQTFKSPINVLKISLSEYWSRRRNPRFNIPKYSIGIKDKKFSCAIDYYQPERLALIMLLCHKKILDQSFFRWSTDLVDLSETSLNEVRLILQDDRLFAQIQQSVTGLTNVDAVEEMFDLLTSSELINRTMIDQTQKSYFSVIVESIYSIDHGPQTRWGGILSQKIFNAILTKHPFVCLSFPSTLFEIRKLGYKTFNGLIDESYDAIENDKYRLLAVVKEIERLCAFSDTEWLSWQKEIQPIVEYNFQHLLSKTQPQDYILEQITAEPR